MIRIYESRELRLAKKVSVSAVAFLQHEINRSLLLLFTTSLDCYYLYSNIISNLPVSFKGMHLLLLLNHLLNSATLGGGRRGEGENDGELETMLLGLLMFDSCHGKETDKTR